MLVVLDPDVRALETVLSARIAGLITGSHTVGVPGTDTFYWLVGTPRITGLIITGECTSAILMGPLLMVVGVVALGGRVRTGRLFLGAVAVSAIVFAANLGRIGLITWATYRYGGAGFTWSHTILGSLVTLLAFAGALVMLAWLLGWDRKPSVPLR